jgi:hypothetical protein
VPALVTVFFGMVATCALLIVGLRQGLTKRQTRQLGVERKHRSQQDIGAQVQS